ncbi:MAG TPA: chromate efflux transporter [Bacteroidia bacterium]|nr:chromate efflux transporter [Bacteroidia bacterium]
MISLGQLFFVFLKIGATAFGGNVALVAAVRKELCEKKHYLKDAQVLDFMTLGNLMPGPLAVNVVAAIGYTLRGMLGAIVATIAVLIPSFFLVSFLADMYFRYGSSPVVNEIFSGLLPGVCAIIAATAWSLAKKNISSVLQVGIVVLAGAAILFFHGFLTTLVIIAVSGLLGLFLIRKKEGPEFMGPPKEKYSPWPLVAMTVLVLAGIILWLIHPEGEHAQKTRLLGLSFGGMSVTLFGGGYVFIPAIEKVVVGMHHWVTSKEFADGIAMGQVTPGPISISAAFIGWRVAGFLGALVSTVAIFFPPAFLMVVAQQFVDRVKKHPVAEAVFSGVRPAVIGMIVASVYVLSKSSPLDWQAFFIFAFVLTLSVWKNVDSALLILASGFFGWALHLF